MHISALLVGILPFVQASAATDSSYKDTTLAGLEQRLTAIDSDLRQLAHFSLRGGVGAIGCRSAAHLDPEHTEWLEIDLEQTFTIDEIVLVPTIWRDTEKGFQADGFPLAFRIIAGTDENRTGSVIVEHPRHKSVLPRIAPLVMPITKTRASWLRIEAMSLSPRAFDGRYALQLAELLVFDGPENVALRCAVTTSSRTRDNVGAWHPAFLVDGFTPYLMDSAQGSQSIAYVSTFRKKSILTLDLGRPHPLSRIHLHAIDQSDTVPQAYAGDLGMPHHLRIEGANSPDFSDATSLLTVLRNTIYETGPIMMWRIPEQNCRFVRLVTEESGTTIESTTRRFRLGFAEIELFSKGTNVALNKAPQANPATITGSNRSLTSLTDGNNLYGRILPVRAWLEQLARRHSLEAERPVVAAELNRRYLHQKKNLTRMKWVAAALTAAVVITILIEWILRMNQAARLRKRFAADLHDELGANLHAIGLLGDLAKEAVNSPDELMETVDEIRALTERTSATTRFLTGMQPTGLYKDLSEDMQRTARRIMADLEYDISIEGNEILEKLRPRTKADLFLFFKESLVNISRHSGATRCTTQLTANHKEICLIISDNGHGISRSLKNGIPTSLKRRAHLLGAQVSAETSAGNGTSITMKFRPRKFGFWR